MKKGKRDPKAVFNPEVYREECPFDRRDEVDTPWVWCFNCTTVFEFGWYVWEDASMTTFGNYGWNKGECVCPVEGCGSYYLDHWWINADGSRADTGCDLIPVPFEAWDQVDPDASDDFKLVG